MRRLIFCEGPDDLNALRAIAQHLRWAQAPSRGATPGAGQARSMRLQAGEAQIEIRVPSKTGGATGEGKSALARMVAAELDVLPPQMGARDESSVAVVGVVFDPDGETVTSFHAEVERAVRAHASKWALSSAGAPGVWRAQREASEVVEVRAVDWRAPGGVVGGLPDHMNLERLLCAVLAAAYPGEVARIERWLAELGAVRKDAGRKPPGWKAAIHLWLAAVYEKADDLNAASRFLHQQSECKPHVESILAQTGLLSDLRPLLDRP